jgi:predicted RNA-binding protein YlxR (DUF448 family)
VTRRPHPVEELIRFVRSPDGKVVPDLKRRLPGRGVWVEARKDRIEEAAKRNVFARGFKDKAEAASDLAAEVEALIERQALDMLAMANKAGRVVTGFGKVESALGTKGVAAVLHATDGAADGKRKLGGPAKKAAVPVIEVFTSGQMDLALGKENVIHAALLADAVSTAFLARASELARYRRTETDQE